MCKELNPPIFKKNPRHHSLGTQLNCNLQGHMFVKLLFAAIPQRDNDDGLQVVQNMVLLHFFH